MLGCLFFAALYLAGDYLSTRFALPIPGSIIGLGMALGVFALRGKVDDALRPCANLLLRYLPLLLVPVGAGVIRIVNAPPAGLWRLEVVLIIAFFIGVLGTAKIAEGLLALGARGLTAKAAGTSGDREIGSSGDRNNL